MYGEKIKIKFCYLILLNEIIQKISKIENRNDITSIMKLGNKVYQQNLSSYRSLILLTVVPKWYLQL